MAQYINGLIKNQKKKIIHTSTTNFINLLLILESLEDDEHVFPYLSGIDKNGDTIFNHMQVAFVLKEIEVLSERVDKKYASYLGEYRDFFVGVGMSEYAYLCGE